MPKPFDYTTGAREGNSEFNELHLATSHRGRFIPTRRHNPCTICGDIKGKCRETPSSLVLLCMNVTDAHSTPVGFKFIGLSKDGLWGKFVKNEGVAASVDHHSWQQSLELKKQQRLATELSARSQLLSEIDRDTEIRRILAQLPLQPLHREDLQRRGLTDDQIAAGMFRSVNKWQKLDFAISHKLAGVSIDGRSLITQSGYICPVWNPSGQIVAWQLRADDTKTGKYKWASSSTKKRPHGPTSHLPNGELPITCCRPIGGTHSRVVRHQEGFVKPWVSAQKHGQIVLGAAGGNFASSPKTLKSYLDQLALELGGIEDIVLDVDAGAVTNPHVMRQYRRTYQLYKKLGYELKVGWWGQLTKDDPDPDEYDGPIRVITWAQFERIARSANRFWDDITRQLSKLGRNLSAYFKGFGQEPSPLLLASKKPVTEKRPLFKKKLIITSQEEIPNSDEYKALGCPTISYRGVTPQEIWLEAVAKGWQHILDSSAPGLGKSFAAGRATATSFGVKQLWYLSSDHRNPTTLTVEQNYVDLPVRHNGLVVDHTRTTPTGQPFLVHPQNADNRKLTVGNCFRTNLFHQLKAKNIIEILGSDSPICSGCHLLSACRASSGAGFGFRNVRRQALSYPQVRAHPDSLPKSDDYDYAACGLFWDEVSTLMKSVDVIPVTKLDLDQTVGELIAAKVPQAFFVLKEVLTVLRTLLEGKITPQSRYGLDDAAIRKTLPPKPENLTQLINELEVELAPDLSFLAESSDGIELKKVDKNVRSAAEFAATMLRQSSYRDTAIELQQVACNWLVPLLRVWNGERGALRCERGVLSIYTSNKRHVSVAYASKFNIYLDGTMTAQHLALKLGINSTDILVVEQATPNYDNLLLCHVTGMGVLGKDRRESMNARVAALKKALQDSHPDIKFLEWKKHAGNQDGYHFRDSRGVNRFSDVTALCSIGIPYPNVGELAALYQVMTGLEVQLGNNDPKFQEFVDAHVQAEIIQECGRLRTHLRSDEQLVYYFVGDYDLSFLATAMPGVKISQLEAVAIAPEAGSVRERTEWAILQAARKLWERGIKLTQTSIAAYADISQGRVSQLAKDWGGWGTFKKLLVSLLTSFSNKTNNSDSAPLDKDAQWFADVYLPLLADENLTSPRQLVQEVVKTVKVFGWRQFEQILTATPLATKAQLLAHIIAVLPADIQAWFVDMAIPPPLEGCT